MTGPLYHLGRLCARHHWVTIALWVVAAVALASVSRAAGDDTTDNVSLPGSGSTNAQDLLQKRLPQQAYGSNPMVLKVKSGELTDSKNSQAVDDTVSALKKTPHVISAVSPLSQEGSSFLSKNKKFGYIPVLLDVGPTDLTKDEAQAVLDAGDPARKAGMKVAIGGYVGQQLSKPSTESSEAVGLTAAVIILLFAFGTVTAMALPILTAVLGLTCTLSIIQLLSHLFDVPTVAPTLGTMIGLGVGIDYALFIVTRHKLQLKQGMEMQESIARASATAGGAVFFAGTTVVHRAVLARRRGHPARDEHGLLLRRLRRGGGVGGAHPASGAAGRVGAADQLPSGQAGPHPSRRPRAPRLGPVGSRRGRSALALRARQPGRPGRPGLPRASARARPAGQQRGAQEHDGAPVLRPARRGLRSRHQRAAARQREARLAGEARPEGHRRRQQAGAAAQGPAAADRAAGARAGGIAAAGPAAGPAADGEAEPGARREEKAGRVARDGPATTLEDDIKKTSGVASVSPATVSKNGNAAVITVVSKTSPSDNDTEKLVRDLRDNVIPAAVKGTDMTVYVGGQTAGYIDLANKISNKLPEMILVVVGLSFLILLMAFRSLPVPVKAAVMNLLSVAAAYGILTFIFQEGHGASLIGLDGPTPIVSFVPLFMFAILFGLSMDYEVFLLSQIQDHYKAEHQATKAVVDGLATTGRVITSAALIMVSVFTSFILSGDPTVKQFGVGLAVAVAIDATLVRCLLVPAVMVLLQDRAWWMPHWLGRLVPRFSIEGEDYFDRLDAAAQAGEAEKSPA